jgi:hypothetical protein
MLLFLFVFALYLGLVAFDAWILVLNVPILVEDPTNFWSWFWIILALSLTLFGGSKASS